MDFSLSLPSLLLSFLLDPTVKQKNCFYKVRVQVEFSDLTDTRGFTLDISKAGMRNILESTYY